jgi:hypothetical protein
LDSKSREAIKIWISSADAIKIVIGLIINLFEKEEFEEENTFDAEFD